MAPPHRIVFDEFRIEIVRPKSRRLCCDDDVRRPNLPWEPEDATRHKHNADRPDLCRIWAGAVNKILAKTGDEGRTICVANAIIARIRRREENVTLAGKRFRIGPQIKDADSLGCKLN